MGYIRQRKLNLYKYRLMKFDLIRRGYSMQIKEWVSYTHS